MLTTPTVASRIMRTGYRDDDPHHAHRLWTAVVLDDDTFLVPTADQGLVPLMFFDIGVELAPLYETLFTYDRPGILKLAVLDGAEVYLVSERGLVDLPDVEFTGRDVSEADSARCGLLMTAWLQPTTDWSSGMSASDVRSLFANAFGSDFSIGAVIDGALDAGLDMRRIGETTDVVIAGYITDADRARLHALAALRRSRAEQ